MRILITGAAGNLGSHVATHLLNTSHELRLMIHDTPLPERLRESRRIEVYRADLGQPATLRSICEEVDCVIHLAGLLFAPNPAKFLPRTNIEYVRNLLDEALRAQVSRFILISFPHVEGETTPERRATDRLDRDSDVIHFRTRAAAERLVLERCGDTATTAVILRAGIVYGRGVKLIEAARWLLRYRLLAVWRQRTWVHLISLHDFLNAVERAIENNGVAGIYNVCDDQPLTLQEFLDKLALHYGYKRPWRLPAWSFAVAAGVSEVAARVLGCSAPLTRDIIRAGMTSAVADNSRMKRELLTELSYPSFGQGLALL
jgi:nucleoside-diphosphate-sugar epimerase